MLVKVLGSGAGGGFPQWNCACRNCASVRAGAEGFRPRTQSSLAVSANGRDFVLLNASPDLRQQIEAAVQLRPASGQKRSSPIKAVVLTNGDVDHIAGLLTLREAQPFAIYAGQRILGVLAANSIFDVLAKGTVARRPVHLGVPATLAGPDGADLGLAIEAFAVPGKIALYLEDAGSGPGFGTTTGDTIGLQVTSKSSGRSFFYIPGCAGLDAPLAARLRGAALLFFDGTLYSDDEMIRLGLLGKTGRRMGHISMSGPEGSVAAFARLGVKRRIFIHINNSNPVLDERSDERRRIEAEGWEVAFDGMEVRL